MNLLQEALPGAQQATSRLASLLDEATRRHELPGNAMGSIRCRAKHLAVGYHTHPALTDNAMHLGVFLGGPQQQTTRPRSGPQRTCAPGCPLLSMQPVPHQGKVSFAGALGALCAAEAAGTAAKDTVMWACVDNGAQLKNGTQVNTYSIGRTCLSQLEAKPVKTITLQGETAVYFT